MRFVRRWRFVFFFEKREKKIFYKNVRGAVMEYNNIYIQTFNNLNQKKNVLEGIVVEEASKKLLSLLKSVNLLDFYSRPVVADIFSLLRYSTFVNCVSQPTKYYSVFFWEFFFFLFLSLSEFVNSQITCFHLTIWLFLKRIWWVLSFESLRSFNEFCFGVSFSQRICAIKGDDLKATLGMC